MFTPCLAALGAIGVTESVRRFKRDENGKNRWQNILLPVSVAAAAAVQVYMLRVLYTDYSKTLVPVIIIGAGLSVLGLGLLKLLKKDSPRLAVLFAAVGIVGLLAIPAYWTYMPIPGGSNATIPVAGPEGTTYSGTGRGSGGGNIVDGSKPGGGKQAPNSGWTNTPSVQQSPGSGLESKPDVGAPKGDFSVGGSIFSQISFGQYPIVAANYMMNHYNGARYLVAVLNAAAAEPIILKYGVGVATLGGFKGTDNPISLEDFKALVAKGELQFYWGGASQNTQIAKWVAGNAVKVDVTEWGGDTGGGVLYDLSGLKTVG